MSSLLRTDAVVSVLATGCRSSATMDALANDLTAAGGGRSNKDAELAKAMFEGTSAYRRKLKMPEMTPEAEKYKSDVRCWPAPTAATQRPLLSLCFSRSSSTWLALAFSLARSASCREANTRDALRLAPPRIAGRRRVLLQLFQGG